MFVVQFNSFATASGQSYFSSLKTNWRTILDSWRKTKRGKISNALPKNVFAPLLTKTLELGEKTAAQNFISGFKQSGICPLDLNVPLKNLPGYGKPIEEIRESIGESFKNYIDDIRSADLGIVTRRKFQIPVTAGKSVSAEEVAHYIEQRENKTKKTKTGPKRGRPVGSKNKEIGPSSKKKKVGNQEIASKAFSKPVIEENIVEEIVFEEPVFDETVIEETVIEEAGIVVEEIVFEEPVFDETVLEETVVEENGIIIEDYEVHDNILCLQQSVNKRERTFCIVNYEGSLFPGRITKATHPKYTVSLMQKTMEGLLFNIIIVNTNSKIKIKTYLNKFERFSLDTFYFRSKIFSATSQTCEFL